MLSVGGSHDIGVVVDHQEVGVVWQPAYGKYGRYNSKHLHYLKVLQMLNYFFGLDMNFINCTHWS